MFLLTVLVLLTASTSYCVTTIPAEDIRVTTTGKGDPVVMIPGLFGSAYSYRKVAPLLNDAGHEVIIIEPLGVGGSARPDNSDYSLTAQARRIAEVLDLRQTGPAVFVAHGVSASMVFRLAVARPDLVKGIVTIDGGPAESATGSGLRHALSVAPILKFFGGEGLLIKKVKGQLVSHSVDASWVTEEALDGYTEGARRNSGAELRAIQQMSNAKEPEAIIPNLPRVTCPVELLQSGFQHSARVGPEEIEVLRTNLPSFQMYSVPNVGHYIQEESPGAVAVAVARVFRRAGEMAVSADR